MAHTKVKVRGHSRGPLEKKASSGCAQGRAGSWLQRRSKRARGNGTRTRETAQKGPRRPRDRCKGPRQGAVARSRAKDRSRGPIAHWIGPRIRRGSCEGPPFTGSTSIVGPSKRDMPSNGPVSTAVASGPLERDSKGLSRHHVDHSSRGLCKLAAVETARNTGETSSRLQRNDPWRECRKVGGRPDGPRAKGQSSGGPLPQQGDTPGDVRSEGLAARKPAFRGFLRETPPGSPHPGWICSKQRSRAANRRLSRLQSLVGI
jgi:hypothetical protein